MFTFLFCTSVTADVINFATLKFNRENNRSPKIWTQLSFTMEGPKIGRVNYASGRKKIHFTIDSHLSGSFLRTDIRFSDSWLAAKRFSSTSKNEMYLGSIKPNLGQRRDLKALAPNEKKMAAWIIANSDELIEFALTSGKVFPAQSKRAWLMLSKNDSFEKNIRKNLGPYLRSDLKEYDEYAKHRPRSLKRMIQPSLKKLGYYKGKIDGLWGNQTKFAIMEFETDNGFFPDGVNYGTERQLLTSKAKDKERYNDVAQIKHREEQYKNAVSELSKKLSIANLEIRDLKKSVELRRSKIRKLLVQTSGYQKLAPSNADEEKLKEEINQATTLAKRQSSLANTRLQQIKNYRTEIANLKKSNNTSDVLNKIKKDLQKSIENLRIARTISNNRMQEITRLQSKVKKLDSSIEAAKLAKKLEEEQHLSQYRNTIIALNQKISNLSQQSASKRELSKKTIELAAAKNKLDLLMNQNDKWIAEIKVLKENKLRIKTGSENLTLRNAELTKQIDQLVEIQEATALKFSELQSENQKLTDRLKELETKIGTDAPLPTFKLSEDWLDVERFLTVQQVRFCQILNNYSLEAKAAAKSKNQLRQNLVTTNRDNDISALLPNGNYKDWVVKVVEVYATPSGDAAFVLRLPCDVTFGSGQLTGEGDLNGVYAATAEFDGIIYNQLAQLSQGDTVLISGKILTYDDIGSLNKRLKFVTTLYGDKTKKSQIVKSKAAPDYFSSIGYLSKL